MRDRWRYVVYRTFLGDLDLMHERQWDEWAKEVHGRTPEEVSRGHTYPEAVALTKFANKLEDDE
jgi:hypothetical protein